MHPRHEIKFERTAHKMDPFSHDRFNPTPTYPRQVDYHPYNCAIDLLSGTMPPRNRIYPLSHTEREAMETYIREALDQEYIIPSTSPAFASFFFIEKKRRWALTVHRLTWTE